VNNVGGDASFGTLQRLSWPSQLQIQCQLHAQGLHPCGILIHAFCLLPSKEEE
jgi:hypothetical protein